ncbi:MAG: hypothetical protein V1733_02370 [bacterium]
MSDSEKQEHLDSKSIREQLEQLELRIGKLEKKVEVMASHDTFSYMNMEEVIAERGPAPMKSEQDDGSLLESKIGEYGLAWLGNIVLFFGIIFLTQYITNLQRPFAAAVMGLISVAGILFLSRSLQKSYSYMSRIFGVFAQLLLFYVTIRLHFFTLNPVIPWKGLAIVLLLLVIGIQVYLFIRRKSEFYAGLALIMSVTVAIISDTTHVMLLVVTLSAAGTTFLFYRYSWYRILIISILLTYLTFFFWILNNPLIGHAMKAVTAHQYTYIYLTACATIFSMVTLIRQNGLYPDHVVLSSILLNGFSFSALLWLWVMVFFPKDYIWLFLSIAVFCIPFSIVLKKFSPWKYSPALYALYGFVAISITIYGLYNFPRAYLLLSIQSFLVISIALWYRSRIIVVMNVFLFLMILTSYLLTAKSSDLINFSFPVVAFFSARLINWQKERLNLQTELIRNTYLITLFLTMLYALFKAVPGPYVTLSWTLAGLLFFALSILLRNIKYRWMALASVIATALYLFIVDLANVEIIYRIMTFLFLAIISIGISFYYVKKLKKRKDTQV